MEHNARAHIVHKSLEGWRRRLSLRRGLSRAFGVMGVGLLVLSGLVVTGISVPLPTGALGSPMWVVAALLGAVVFTSLIALVTSRFSRQDAAQVADLRHSTGALFTTAEGILSKLERGEPISEAQSTCLERASTKASRLTPALVAPLRPSLAWVAPALIVALGVLLPQLPFAVDHQEIQDKRRLTAAAKAVEELKKNLDTPKPGVQIDPAVRKQLRRLARRIEEKDIKPRAALEQIGELKRRLRTEKLKSRERASKTNRAARDAARELGRSDATSKLAQRLSEGARLEQSSQQRLRNAKKAADAVRELKRLSKTDRERAQSQLSKASKASEVAGDMRLAEALQNASSALGQDGSESLDASAEDLRDALEKLAQNQEHIDELAEALEQVQRQLAGGGNPGRGRAGGDEGQVAPAPRDWSKGSGPSGQGKPVAQAGKGHSDEEVSPDEKKPQGHQDANRTAEGIKPTEKEVDYKELYVSSLLEDPNRVLTAVKGEKGSGVSKQTDVLRGGRQTPREERARLVIERLPVAYADDVRDAMEREVIPPAYRAAVKGYFDDGR